MKRSDTTQRQQGKGAKRAFQRTRSRTFQEYSNNCGSKCLLLQHGLMAKDGRAVRKERAQGEKESESRQALLPLLPPLFSLNYGTYTRTIVRDKLDARTKSRRRAAGAKGRSSILTSPFFPKGAAEEAVSENIALKSKLVRTCATRTRAIVS